jgi:ferrous iron transport protein B
MALAGNPNSGKTTIFNAITGARQHVGNYPGVTVERREGEAEHAGRHIRVIDLPGAYSLSAHSPDELVARKVLLEEKPDVVVQIVDAGNLERNLYLAVQLIEMKIPLVLAFNMMDEVEKKGVKIDIDQLSALLGVPVVPTVGFRGEGIRELLDRAVEVALARRRPRVDVRFGADIDKAVLAVQEVVEGSAKTEAYDPRWLSIKLLEADSEVMEWVKEAGGTRAADRAEREQERLKSLLGDDPEILIADARYGWVHGAVAETVSLAVEERRSLTDRVDTVLANRVLGLPIFLFLMWLTFETTFTLGAPLIDLIDAWFGWLGVQAAAVMRDGLLRSLVVDGVIAGVGGVLVFLPNIVILFIMVSLMEDSGYMARAAFIVDRVMHLVGLHGKSFIPMFVGFGCNVPAIMGARILENERDRITTVLVCPFMSCSARLPVFVLLAGAFFPARTAGNVVFSLYILGVVVAMVVARLLRTYAVKGPPTPFVMELPPYRMPTVKSVAIHVGERAWMYVKKAGTLILAVSIVIWFLSNFPRDVKYSPDLDAAIADAGAVESLPDEMRLELSRQRLENSYAGMFGRAVAPALKPAGLDDWKIGISLFAGFAAKEIVVSTMGTLYSLGESDEQARDLRAAVKADPFFSPLRAYAFMVFVLLYVPCLATVIVAYRELGSWKWALLMVVTTTGAAYVLSSVVWWTGKILGFS